MSKYDDEFKDVKKGVPTGNATQKASINFVALFTIVGVVLALVIILFQGVINDTGNNLVKNGYAFQQALVNGVLALLVGSIQAWIFKARIKTRGYIFVGFSLLGGLIAGLIGGLILTAGLKVPVVIGLINGSIAGGISSLAQNSVMRNSKYGINWFIYSVISWAIVFAIGWVIGWERTNIIRIAAAGAFLMIASGVSLAIFVNNTPQIEFS